MQQLQGVLQDYTRFILRNLRHHIARVHQSPLHSDGEPCNPLHHLDSLRDILLRGDALPRFLLDLARKVRTEDT